MGWKHLTRITQTFIKLEEEKTPTKNAFWTHLLETAGLELIWRRLCLIAEWANSIAVVVVLPEFLLICRSSGLALKKITLVSKYSTQNSILKSVLAAQKNNSRAR